MEISPPLPPTLPGPPLPGCPSCASGFLGGCLLAEASPTKSVAFSTAINGFGDILLCAAASKCRSQLSLML